VDRAESEVVTGKEEEVSRPDWDRNGKEGAVGVGCQR
jgi:hypothetical protein